ncbi:MAG: Cytochrome c oxidase copper chaperone [Peltula sp. TS41687]|nr:MAG: Cytochrome c oxidase copper chaperone [Peltula sp. TS41687]
MSTQTSSSSEATSRTVNLLDVKAPEAAPTAVKPCCVCKDEKAARDECMLFSDGDPKEKCRSTIEQYRSCMAGYGFKLPEAVE